MRTLSIPQRALLGAVLSLGNVAALAQATPAQTEMRDPTLAPAALRASPMAEPDRAAVLAPQQIVALDGRYFVVAGGRRLKPGDRLGEARIVRIDEAAVWLSEAGVTRRHALFPGIEKRPEMQVNSSNGAEKRRSLAADPKIEEIK